MDIPKVRNVEDVVVKTGDAPVGRWFVRWGYAPEDGGSSPLILAKQEYQDGTFCNIVQQNGVEIRKENIGKGIGQPKKRNIRLNRI